MKNLESRQNHMKSSLQSAHIRSLLEKKHNGMALFKYYRISPQRPWELLRLCLKHSCPEAPVYRALEKSDCPFCMGEKKAGGAPRP